MPPINRVVGDGQLLDELRATFTHSKPMNWFLPPSTNKTIAVDLVVVVQFREGKVACEPIYWDQAAALRQIGLLNDQQRSARSWRRRDRLFLI
jgi:carboxymethylenebutenolidase